MVNVRLTSGREINLMIAPAEEASTGSEISSDYCAFAWINSYQILLRFKSTDLAIQGQVCFIAFMHN